MAVSGLTALASSLGRALAVVGEVPARRLAAQSAKSRLAVVDLKAETGLPLMGLALRFRGDATVPTLGQIANIRGRVYPATSGWRLDSRGVLGRPVRVSGSLTLEKASVITAKR